MGFNFILYKVVSVLYNLVTRLRQPCHHLAGWKQSSHNLVTTMYMVNNIITTLSPSCYNLVTTLFIVHNLVAALSQSCHKLVQPCHFYMGSYCYSIIKLNKRQKYAYVWPEFILDVLRSL